MKKLKSNRKKIDVINKKITKLLIKRFYLVEQIRKLKIKSGGPLLDKSRQKEILKQVQKTTKRADSSKNIETIFKKIISESLKYMVSKKTKSKIRR
jgi:chorismate mutase/prephenate dehydratase